MTTTFNKWSISMTSSTDPRPNVVLVFADDLATWAIGAYGSRDAHTPNLDRLAAQGMLAENFFCASPVCSPARASLLTGKIPSQHGVHDWVRGGNAGLEGIDFLDGQTALHDVLSGAGYRCGMIGKWHLGASDSPREAFDTWYAYEKGGGVYFSAPVYRGADLEHPEAYLTDVLAEEAVDFLRGAAEDERPFYLNLSFTAPHYPWVDAHPIELVDLFADATFDDIPRMPAHPWLLLQNPETAAAIKDPEASLRGYFAAVAGLDRALGRVLDEIDALDLAGETLVALVGDNGFNAGHHGVWGKGNGTLPQNMYDTSVRVPAIFRHPRRIPSDVRISESLSGYDLLPTLLDFVGLDPLTVPTGLPGSSFTTLLEGASRGANHPIVVFDEYGPVRMIRTGEWKLVDRIAPEPSELFHLSRDPDEDQNLFDDPRYRQIRDQLKSQMEEWFERYTVPELDGRHLPVLGLGQRTLVRGHAPSDVFVPMAPPGTVPVLE
ncbi:sulfatase-like hydrolase/transferase [Microbacterium sp. NPDC056044]|uniref:sulfatase-like hydrolase/transferase n=1 Tax=Microbacterium sp. NPDC056044 TaxID=3345690 RepID=UPI0035DE78D9